jgi:hypothetical protein
MCMLRVARGREGLFGYVVFLVSFVVESAFVWVLGRNPYFAFVWKVFAIGFFCCSNMGES